MFWWVVGFGCLFAWALKCVMMGPESRHISIDVMFWGMPLLGVKIGTKLPSKHDMFWCWFTQWFMLPVHQNSH